MVGRARGRHILLKVTLPSSKQVSSIASKKLSVLRNMEKFYHTRTFTWPQQRNSQHGNPRRDRCFEQMDIMACLWSVMPADSSSPWAEWLWSRLSGPVRTLIGALSGLVLQPVCSLCRWAVHQHEEIIHDHLTPHILASDIFINTCQIQGFTNLYWIQARGSTNQMLKYKSN